MSHFPGIAATKLNRCPVCDGQARTWRVKATSHGEFPIDTCSACGFGFVNPRPSSEYLMNFYAVSGLPGEDQSEVPTATLEDILAAEQAFPNSTLDASRIVRNTSYILADKTRTYRLLDVGCGFGFYSREARGAGFEVTAIELASHERGVATQLAGIVPQAVSFEAFSAEPKSFSAIVMSQILEHAEDVNVWVAKANSLLVPHGVLAIALPNFASIFRWLMQEDEPFVSPPAHLNYFSAGSLTTLLERHGFQVRKTQWSSRLGFRAIEKRIPKVGRAMTPMLEIGSKAILRAIDAAHLGQMITVYAEKEATFA
jgi:2-polyprenyl-3-methyl-5-hydroxy-6-metoxy-1,4-benzoquinol methylase